jgi:hypothetical protein
MLRINLLPSYVAQRRMTKKFIVAWTVAFAAVVAIELAFQFAYLYPTDASETQKAQEAVQAQTYITSENALASSTTATVAPIQGKINFVNGVQTYNQYYPTLFETVARFTSPRILYYGMSVSGSTMTIDAYTPSIDELGRYLQVMYHEPDFTSVSISSIPTPDQAAEKVYYYKGAVIGESGGTNKTSAAGTTTTTSLPGIPPGISVTLPAGVVLPSAPTAASANRALPSTTPTTPNAAATTAGTPAGVYATILSDPNFNPKYYKVVPKKTDGFAFVATCGLKTTIAPPAVPSGAGAAPVQPGAPGAPG